MRHPPLSLALRLTLLFAGVATIVFLAFGWIILDSIEKHFREEDISELEIITETVQHSLAKNHPIEDLTHIEDRFSDILTGHHSASLYLAGSNGQKIYSSAGPDLSNLATTFHDDHMDKAIRVISDANHNYRVLIRRFTDETSPAASSYTFATAVMIDHHLQFLKSFRHILTLMIASGIILTGLMGWFAVRHGHAPLLDIITRIRRISANELNTRLSPEMVPSELVELAESFNDMLERMEDAFRRLSNYSADIAHELRTPVANLMTQAQVALTRARSIDEYREVLYSAMEEYERMAQMIGDMLFLAQAENGLCKPNTTNVNLTEEVRGLFDYYEAWAEERGVRLKLEGTAVIMGDRLMLRRALSNILSNAIRHTPATQSVLVFLDGSCQDSASIVVENPGIPISPEHVPRLFDRFYRIESSRQREIDGVGLGLAIVKSIVNAHCGSIEVISTQGRTQFQIILPGNRTLDS